MPGRINQAYEADDAQFDQALITGQIGWKSIEMMPHLTNSTRQELLVELVKLGGNPLRLCLVELGGNPLRLCLVELGGNPLR